MKHTQYYGDKLEDCAARALHYENLCNELVEVLKKSIIIATSFVTNEERLRMLEEAHATLKKAKESL